MNQRNVSDAFREPAWHHARFRPEYPNELFHLIAERFGLDGTGHLLDLGCRTGRLTLPLARCFELATGMDPDPAMLAEAASRAQHAGVLNVQWLRAGFDDLKQVHRHVGDVRLATTEHAAQRAAGDRMLRDLAEMIEPGGGVAIVSDAPGLYGGTTDWQDAVRTVVQRWTGQECREINGIVSSPVTPWKDIVSRSVFVRPESHRITADRKWHQDSILGWLYSTSLCSPVLLGENRASFESDMRERLSRLNADDEYVETVEVETIFAWRGAA
jgi:SAM-dependent methyltransferase